MSLGNPDHAAGHAPARVACWLGFEIIRFLMNDNGTPDDRPLVICQRDMVIDIVQFCRAGSVCFDVAHVTDMPRGRIRARMRLLGWIEMAAGGVRILGAAIAEFMNVKTMFTRSEPGDVRLDADAIGFFSKCHGAGDFVARGRMKHSNGF